MAKKRILKRDIGYVAGDLFTEVLLLMRLVPGVDQEKADGLMTRISDMYDEYMTRAHRPDGKDNKKIVKQYYSKLIADLQAEVDAIAKEIEGLSKGKLA